MVTIIRKWIKPEFKTKARLFEFNILMIPLGKV